jgi:hypothetical protein
VGCSRDSEGRDVNRRSMAWLALVKWWPMIVWFAGLALVIYAMAHVTMT